MYRLDKKLEVLRSEQLAVNEESHVNETLGTKVSDHITRVARPQEIAKYRLHVEEVGKITSLLLGLSGRLARAENALMGLPSDHLERVSFLKLKYIRRVMYGLGDLFHKDLSANCFNKIFIW